MMEQAPGDVVTETEPASKKVERRTQSKKRAQRLRAHRIRVDALNLGRVHALCSHPALGRLETGVEDLSLHGLALVVPREQTSLILSGDRLVKLEVLCDDDQLYRGEAIVRRVTERGDELVLGVELESGGLDLGTLYRRGERQSFAERLRRVDLDAQAQEVSTEFKAWVLELRTYLERLKAFLDEEEESLRSVDLLSQQEANREYVPEASSVIVRRLNKAAGELAELVSGLENDRHPAHRAFFRDNLLPLIGESPLLRRAYEKPLGYAGDYEVMNMLYRDHAEGPSLFAKAVNTYGAQEPAAQANINRIEYLQGQILRTVAETPACQRVRVASIGCGPAQELQTLLRKHPEVGSRLDVALIDQEERAITYCERTLGPCAAKHGARVEFIRESVRRLLTSKQLSETLGERDLIYSAGLFDYLNQRSFAALLGALYSALVTGGRLIVGNVADDNPTRWFMEYCLDWYLVHRSRDELRELAGALSPRPSEVAVDAEPLGVNLFLTIRR